MSGEGQRASKWDEQSGTSSDRSPQSLAAWFVFVCLCERSPLALGLDVEDEHVSWFMSRVFASVWVGGTAQAKREGGRGRLLFEERRRG